MKDCRGPIIEGPLSETAAVEIQALNGILAQARSRPPTDSPPAACPPDDSDSSRCLARALAPELSNTPLLRADVTRLDSLGDPAQAMPRLLRTAVPLRVEVLLVTSCVPGSHPPRSAQGVVLGQHVR
jgi:hypothetical protein